MLTRFLYETVKERLFVIVFDFLYVQSTLNNEAIHSRIIR